MDMFVDMPGWLKLVGIILIPLIGFLSCLALYTRSVIKENENRHDKSDSEELENQ